MKLPKTLKLDGKTYKITYEPNMTAYHEVAAQIRFQAQEIAFDSLNKDDNNEESLIHEILEYINYAYELSLPHHQICTISTSLHQILKDNKLHF